MGQRLTQIATRTGDDGSTGLGDGTRVPKDHLRVMAMGDVDELNSGLGVLLAEPLPDDVRELLVTIQHELFNLGGELSIPGYQLLKPAAVLRLDEALEHYNAQLPRLKEFILPAGTRSAALAHVSRTVARRAERSLVALSGHETVNAGASPVPQPLERPDVRAGARAQSRQPRRAGRRRRLLALRAPGSRRRLRTRRPAYAGRRASGAVGTLRQARPARLTDLPRRRPRAG